MIAERRRLFFSFLPHESSLPENCWGSPSLAVIISWPVYTTLSLTASLQSAIELECSNNKLLPHHATSCQCPHCDVLDLRYFCILQLQTRLYYQTTQK